MSESRWTWLVFVVWFVFVITAFISIGVFWDNKTIEQVTRYGFTERVFNYYSLLSCISTIVGAFIMAATISMIESIYRVVVKQNNQQ